MAFSWNLPKQLLLIWRCYDVFYVCPLSCIKLYSFEVALCKISGLKLHKMLKLWIHEPCIMVCICPLVHIYLKLTRNINLSGVQLRDIFSWTPCITIITGKSLWPYSTSGWDHDSSAASSITITCNHGCWVWAPRVAL